MPDTRVEITVVMVPRPGASTGEDAVQVGPWVAASPMSQPIQVRKQLGSPLLVTVADGLGGEPAGEVASELACWELAGRANSVTDAARLQECLLTAHQALLEDVSRVPARRGMATTVAAVLITSEEVIVANVGDSRVYEQLGGFLRQRSTDDRPAEGHGAAGTVTQVLGGSGAPPRPHVTRLPMRPARFLACTDGLSDVVDEDGLERALADDPKKAAERLLAAADAAGRYDDVALAIIDIAADGGPHGV